MNSRERVSRALDHQEPDRVPIDCWASAGTRAKIEEATGLPYSAFLDKRDVDLRYIDGPEYVGPSLKARSTGEEVDLWGVPRKRVHIHLHDGTGQHEETYNEVVSSPLKDLQTREEILAYERWPSADWFDYSGIEAQCDKIRERGRVVVFMGDRLNRLAQLKPAMYLRGTEQILVDMLVQPDVAQTIFDKIREFYLEYGNRILESARGRIDILCTGDDFGAQRNLLIPPDVWRDQLQAGFAAYVAMGKSWGARVMHHSCGAVRSLVPAMIGIGLDILQSLQPEAGGMTPEALKRDFGDRICFQGGVSIQSVLPHGTPDQVRRHVESLFGAMAPGGGFIACTSHNIQADTSMENINALFDAYGRYGSYT